MRSEKIRDMARDLGLHEYQVKADIRALIPAIQARQGKDPCFLSDKRFFCEERCEWRQRCQKLTAAWRR